MKNLLPQFIKHLEASLKTVSSVNHVMLENYIHLFKILNYPSDKALDYVYNRWLEIKDDEVWFYEFHKSIRQCDFFEKVYTDVSKRNYLTEEETDRRNELSKQWAETRQHLEDYEFNSDDYIMAEAKWRIETRAMRKEYYELNRKYNQEETENIGGHLDSILWNMIHMDKNEVLFNNLIIFFETTKNAK